MLVHAEMHLFLVVFFLLWLLNCSYIFILFLLIIWSAFFSFILFDLIFRFRNTSNAWIVSCSPENAIACIIKIRESPRFSFKIFRLSVEGFHRSIGKTCIVFLFVSCTLSIDLYFNMIKELTIGSLFLIRNKAKSLNIDWSECLYLLIKAFRFVSTSNSLSYSWLLNSI